MKPILNIICATKCRRVFATEAVRMKMTMVLILVCVSGLWTGARADAGEQHTAQDSLYATWKDSRQTDSVRVQAFKTYIWDGYLFSNPDSAIVLAEEMRRFGEEQNYPIAEYQSYTLLSIAHNFLGNNALSRDYIRKSLAGNEAIGNLPGISECEIVIGVAYDEQGNHPRALEHYHKALSIDEKIGNKEGMAMSINNIGNIYRMQGEYSDALEYYERALAIDEELGVKQGIAVELVNIGGILNSKGDTTSALEHFERALALYEEIGDKEGKASVIKTIAGIYHYNGQDARALAYYEEALKIYEEIGYVRGLAETLESIGRYYLNQGETHRALEYCQTSLAYAEEVASLQVQENACKCLYVAHKTLGDNGKALKYHEQMIAARDRLYNEENTKKLTQLQMQYDFDKKEAATQAEQEKKDAIARQELKRQKLVRNGFMGGFAVVLLFAGVFLVQRNRIGKERQRSEKLLLNILPEETAQELKKKGHADAQLFEEVTVLFTDFKGFTAMSEKLSPEELVKDLHLCFSLFDQICEKYGIEKIKTIGDAYMAAGGLPTPNSTHAQDVVSAALEMAKVVEDGKTKKIVQGLPFFEVRVGVHTGPVVAGIVGIKKFQYDIWGDTVNTASRMESSGKVGRVNISQTTYDLLKENPQYAFESRGKIKAKGKGEIEMFFVSKA